MANIKKFTGYSFLTEVETYWAELTEDQVGSMGSKDLDEWYNISWIVVSTKNYEGDCPECGDWVYAGHPCPSCGWDPEKED